jgi:anti-sigma factor RsiW
MRYLGGHLGTAVSALVDGQLDPASADRAWDHVHGCQSCRRQVEREGWVKTQLAGMTGDDAPPPPQLLGSLYDLRAAGQPAPPESPESATAWAAVEALERRDRDRRRTAVALVGAGSLSVAVLGFAAFAGAGLGIGAAPSGTPTSALTHSPATGTPAMVGPLARVHGTLPGGEREQGRGGHRAKTP